MSPFRYLIVTIAALSFCIPASGACACDAGIVWPANPCPTLTKSGATFVGTAISITGPIDSILSILPDPVYQYRFRVDENLFGANSKEVDVYSDARCGASFDIETKYLVFTYKLHGLLMTGICGGSQPAASAADLISELRAQRDSKSVPSISGWLRLDRMPPYGISPLDGRPVSGITLTLVGSSHTLTTQTDVSGYYHFDNIPADTYHFVAALPPNLALDDSTSGLEHPYKLPEKACYEIELRAVPAVPDSDRKAPP